MLTEGERGKGQIRSLGLTQTHYACMLSHFNLVQFSVTL